MRARPTARLFVTNFTEGTVSVVDTGSGEVEDEVDVGGNPYGITIVGHNVFVTAVLRAADRGRARRGVRRRQGRGGARLRPQRSSIRVKEITLSPLADSGFTANRVNLCTNSTLWRVNDTFCPDTNASDPTDPVITMDPQAVYPNQLKTALACNGLLYLPNVGAQPEPPVGLQRPTFRRWCMWSILAHLPNERTSHVNLNEQIAEAAPADRPASLARLFGNELVAIDADSDCENFFIVSRGGNYVLKAQLGPDGKLDIGAPDNVVRFQTGNIPTGIDGRSKRASAPTSTTRSTCRSRSSTSRATPSSTRDVPSSTPPEPGSFDHARMLGSWCSSPRSACRTTASSARPSRHRPAGVPRQAVEQTPGARAARATTRAWPTA